MRNKCDIFVFYELNQNHLVMNAKYELGYCSTCVNRDFNARYGIICGITKERPDFVGACSSYATDGKEFNAFLQKYQRSIDILKRMKGDVEVSGGMTEALFYISLIFPIATIAISYFLYRNGSELTDVLLGGGLFFLIAFGFSMFYGSMSTVTVSLDQEIISFVKTLGRTERYSLDSIHMVEAINYGRSRFTRCTIQLENKELKSFTIYNSKSYFDRHHAMADECLDAARNYNMLKRFLTQ
jgi:hypothetical protein